ncbi:hypothetical protein KAI54_03160 [Candidatus Gracilibacteria bacterium]|nr:hypothetical protein [Candidatus Gracilibacteria bacterium]
MRFIGKTFPQLNEALIGLRENEDIRNGCKFRPKEEWGESKVDFQMLKKLMRDFVETVYFQTNPEDQEESQEIKTLKITRKILDHLFSICRETGKVISPKVFKKETLLFEGIANPNSEKCVFAKIENSKLVVGFSEKTKKD